MNYFSIPADFRETTIKKIADLNNEYCQSKVIEVYGQATDTNFSASGRIIDMIPEVRIKQLERYVYKCSNNNITFNYLLNPSCTGNAEFNKESQRELYNLIKKLLDCGIRRFTITAPSLVELLVSIDSRIEIKISAINEINSPLKALFYKSIGAKRIVVDPDVNRDFYSLKNIAETFGGSTEVIVNILCYKNCAYKMFHYNHEAHCKMMVENETITSYYFNRCYLQKASAPENFLKINWIRPEDLHYYNKIGIFHFKIQGRQNIIQGDIIRTLKAYFNEKYNGNLMDLITLFYPYNSFQPHIDNEKLDGFLAPFFTNTGFCSQLCNKCRHCWDYASKCMDISATNCLNDQARLFYNEIDKYRKTICNIANEKNILT